MACSIPRSVRRQHLTRPPVVGEHAIALEEVLPRVFDLAFDHARKNKRSEINAADIAFVQKAFKTK